MTEQQTGRDTAIAYMRAIRSDLIGKAAAHIAALTATPEEARKMATRIADAVLPEDYVRELPAILAARSVLEPSGDVVEKVAASIKASLGPDHVMGNLVPECYEDFARAAIVAMPPQGVTAEQVAYIKAATLQEEANWWETVRPTTVGRTQFGTWLRGRADVHLRAAGVPVQTPLEADDDE